MLLVKKKDGSDRLCIDFCELNASKESDKYPLPLISDQIDRLRGSKYCEEPFWLLTNRSISR